MLFRSHPKKRLENLLRALAVVMSRQPLLPWSLVVAGSGEPAYVSKLQQLSRQLGLQQRCRWVGFASGQQKLELLQSSAWFILPSSAENFAIAAAESLAAGTPVILSPEVGIAAEVEMAGAGLISSAEPERLADTVIKALQSQRDLYSQAALCLARERYSWSVIAADLEDVYRRVSSTSPAS